MKIIDYVIESTNKYIEQMPKEIRKKNGQFFTSKETALFMASLFDLSSFSKEISILDPGAGSGILTAALVQRIIDTDKIKTIKITCYETDGDILELLNKNLLWIRDNSPLKIEYKIVKDNYITSQTLEYNNVLGVCTEPEKYDVIIGNPPYSKIGKTANEALFMPDICYGAPNLYFLFMEMASFNLIDNGELIFIVPRLWTSGAYFRKFREKFLREVVLRHTHLFVSRDKVFDKEAVLQETIIIKAKKESNKSKNITITTTNANFDFDSKTVFEAPYDMVVSGEHKYVFLITDKEEADTIKKVNEWNDTLPTLGLKMKTGLTVDFRNREALRNDAEEKAVPLFYSQHIKDGKVIFPVGKENEYLLTEQKGLLQENTNYLFVKRFTAKEEKRRLQCGIYLAKKFPTYKAISTQNKINFITGLQGLSDCLVYGLYVGDTIQKDLVKNEEKLRELGFEITLHDKMPDVVLYSEDKNWIYFIESVTSVGAIEPKRIKEIEEMTENVSAGKIYVAAFLDFKTFKKFSETLACETEVWIADMPDHMIHLNGDKFLGPRK